MKIAVNENSDIVLTEVFSGVLFKSSDKEEFGICMRDTGFEFNYGGNWYEAKQGVIKKMVSSITEYDTKCDTETERQMSQ